MRSNLLFFLIIISVVVSALYLVWKWWTKNNAENNTEKRMLHYFLLHLLVALHFVLLLLGLTIVSFWGRNGTVEWLLDSPTTVQIEKIVLEVWIIGVVVILIWWALQHVRDMIRYRGRGVVSPEILAISKRVASEVGISKHKLKIWNVYGFESPELGGWFRPVIYLPDKEYDEDMLNNIITHELVHFVYGDKWFRELGMLVLCLYWFNPLTWNMVRQLKLWDEYHCDYQVCGYDHIDRDSYIRTLCEMAMKAYSRNLLNPCFAEEGSDIVKRLHFIEGYKKINATKWIASVMTMTAIFTMLGSVTALAAGTATNMAYNEISAHTTVGQEEVETEVAVLEEYTMSIDELENIPLVEDPGISTLALYTISVTLQNQRYQSASFNVSTGDTVAVYVLADPTDVYLKVGLVQPNGVLRYVYNCGNFSHTFTVNQDGYHKVFVWNETDTSVDVGGSYRVTYAE